MCQVVCQADNSNKQSKLYERHNNKHENIILKLLVFLLDTTKHYFSLFLPFLNTQYISLLLHTQEHYLFHCQQLFVFSSNFIVVKLLPLIQVNNHEIKKVAVLKVTAETNRESRQKKRKTSIS